nr:polysaccharide biosynthesis protein [Bacilli bacterium]
MKKQGFIEGTMVGTIATIICKVLGLLYVIPFRAIVGAQGGALYGYGYNIYMVFLSLATSGIPIAMSKIISEYNTMEMHYAKNRAYKIGSRLIVGLGFISFLVVFIFARSLAYLIIGDNLGGNTIEGVTLVIRVVSTALLIVPIQSVKKGYLQGHKYMTVPQSANVIEQVVRVIVIIFGSYITYKVLHRSLDLSVSVAVFGATLGAIVSYSFISIMMNKNKEKFNVDTKAIKEEKKLTDKVILKKIVMYALPFILIDLIKSAYNTIDMFTVVRTMTNMGFDINLAEEVLADLTTWGSKLNMIVTSLVVGLSAALVPNIMSSFVKKDYKDVNKKINQSLEILLISAIPLTLGLSFMGDAIWTVFYGTDPLGATIFKVQIFTALTLTFHSVLIDATQTLNDSKMSIGMLLLSFVLKTILNIPSMYLFKMMGLEPYYGTVAVTLLTQGMVIVVLLYDLYKKFSVNYSKSFTVLWKTILANLIMFIVLYILKLFIPFNDLGRGLSLVMVIVYGGVGVFIYLITTIRLHIYDDIFSEKAKNEILKKLHIKG